MTDIVEQLNLLAAWWKPANPTPSGKMPSIFDVATEAATEIAQLRKQIAVPDTDALEFVKNAVGLADFDFDRGEIGDEQWAENIALAALAAAVNRKDIK